MQHLFTFVFAILASKICQGSSHFKDAWLALHPEDESQFDETERCEGDYIPEDFHFQNKQSPQTLPEQPRKEARGPSTRSRNKKKSQTEKKYGCLFCNLAFKHLSAFKRHLDTLQHLDDIPVACRTCNEPINCGSQYWSHTQQHHQDQIKELE